MKREIPIITISCGKNDMFMDPPCNFRPNVSTSTSYFSGVSIREINIPDTSAPARKEFLDSLTQLQPYVGPEFVPYTQSSQPFVEPDLLHAPPQNTDPVIVNKKNIDKSVAFRKSGDYENALKSCNEALKADPKYLDGWNEKAAIFINKAEYKTAIEYCDIAIIIDSKYFYAYNNKAVALRKLEDYENALKSCDEALKINQGYSDARNEKNNILNGFYLQISTLITKKQYEEAIKACDIIIKSDAKNLHAYHNKVMALRMLEDYENALKNCDKSILYMGNINNYGIGKVEELNKLYLERKKQHIEAAAKRDYFYSQGVINGVNGFDWYKANPTRDFYSFFRDTLKVSDKSPENVKLIKGRLYTNLPPYLEEARKSNYFLDEYNKYYKDMVASKEKLSQFIYIYNTKAIASKKLGDYESALKSCDIAIKINPKDLEASNFKNFILKEKADFEKAIEYSDNTLRIKPSYQMSNFDYFLKVPYLSQVSTIDVSNNQIGDDGAKVIADSLIKGKFPHLKTLRLEGNKLTDEGQDALINALKNETVQDVIITAITLYEKYQLNISGNKEKQRSILENQLERAKAHGVDVDKVVVDNTTKGWIEHKGGLHGSITFGWTKCFIAYDDIQSFAGERLIAKTSKKGSVWNDLKDAVLCYFEAEKEVLLTEPGVRDTKYQLEALETSELIGNIEANYDVPPL
jgi:tetratricopeptide (TPR) repeat protein